MGFRAPVISCPSDFVCLMISDFVPMGFRAPVISCPSDFVCLMISDFVPMGFRAPVKCEKNNEQTSKFYCFYSTKGTIFVQR